jgi:hypothetical protein
MYLAWPVLKLFWKLEKESRYVIAFGFFEQKCNFFLHVFFFFLTTWFAGLKFSQLYLKNKRQNRFMILAFFPQGFLFSKQHAFKNCKSELKSNFYVFFKGRVLERQTRREEQLRGSQAKLRVN